MTNVSTELIEDLFGETIPQLSKENYRSQKEASIIGEVSRLNNLIEPIKDFSFFQEVDNELSQIYFDNTKHRTYSLKTQRWIGHVTDITEDRFFARLDDMNTPGTYETAEFSISKISPEDIQLLTKGAIFYWSVGDVITNGQLKEEAILRFQRLSDWTSDELDEVADKAKEQLRNISWNDFNSKAKQA